jgi:hypothetical protein
MFGLTPIAAEERRSRIGGINKIGHSHPARHARPCAGHPRPLSLNSKKDVDGRDKPGHDEK